MSWVNAPPCKVCGNKDTEMKTVRGPETEEELAGGAKRVEGKLVHPIKNRLSGGNSGVFDLHV